MNGKDFTLKNINTTIDAKDKDGDKPIKYKIEYENKDGTDKITVDNKKGTKKITAKSIKRIVDGNETDVTDKSLEVEYADNGWFTHYGKIEKVDGKEVKDAEVKFSGMNSFKITFWILIGVVILAVLGGL
jgi:hypothetical protein